MRSVPEPRLVQIVEVLFKRKVAILCFLLGTIAAAALVAQPVYRAEAQLLLQVGHEHVVDAGMPAALLPSVRFEQSEQTSLASEVLKGHSLALEVVRKLGAGAIYDPSRIAPDSSETDEERAARALRENTDVTSAGTSTLLKVGFKHKDPEVAALVTNALADGFLERHMAIFTDRDQRAFLEEQLAQRRAELNEREQQLERFKLEKGLITGSIADERTRLSDQLRSLQIDGSKATIATAEVRERLNHLSRVQRDSTSLESGRSRLLSRDAANDLQSGLVEEETTLQGLRVREQAVEREITALGVRLAEIEAIANEFGRLEERVELSREQYKLHLKKVSERQFSEAMESRGLSSVRIIERAFVPRKPISDHRILGFLALMAGVTGGILWAFVLEFVFGTVDTASAVARQLGAVPIAAIPDFSSE